MYRKLIRLVNRIFIKEPDLNYERGLKSNCCGTVVYVLGLENLAREEADNPKYLTGKFFECPERPGCLDMDTMERILSPRILHRNKTRCFRRIAFVRIWSALRNPRIFRRKNSDLSTGYRAKAISIAFVSLIKPSIYMLL